MSQNQDPKFIENTSVCDWSNSHVHSDIGLKHVLLSHHFIYSRLFNKCYQPIKCCTYFVKNITKPCLHSSFTIYLQHKLNLNYNRYLLSTVVLVTLVMCLLLVSSACSVTVMKCKSWDPVSKAALWGATSRWFWSDSTFKVWVFWEEEGLNQAPLYFPSFSTRWSPRTSIFSSFVLTHTQNEIQWPGFCLSGPISGFYSLTRTGYRELPPALTWAQPWGFISESKTWEGLLFYFYEQFLWALCFNRFSRICSLETFKPFLLKSPNRLELLSSETLMWICKFTLEFLHGI